MNHVELSNLGDDSFIDYLKTGTQIWARLRLFSLNPKTIKQGSTIVEIPIEYISDIFNTFTITASKYEMLNSIATLTKIDRIIKTNEDIIINGISWFAFFRIK